MGENTNFSNQIKRIKIQLVNHSNIQTQSIVHMLYNCILLLLLKTNLTVQFKRKKERFHKFHIKVGLPIFVFFKDG